MGRNLLQIVIVCTLLPVFTVGCAHYRAASLPALAPEFAPYSEQKEGVTVACKALTRTDCKRYLDRDVIAKGYQPVQIVVRNDTKRYLLFSAQGVSIPCVPAEEVARTVHTSTAGRATGYGVAGLFIWPFLIPAVVDGVGSSNANQSLDIDFTAKGVKEQVIQPYSTLNGLLFFPTSDYQGFFTLTMFDKETKDKFSFDVTARK